MTDLPALKKLSGTVETIIKVAEGVPNYSQAELNQAEAKIRNEFQVVEAHLFHVGQEFYNLVQARRLELRRKSIMDLDNIIKEEDGTRSSGGTGDGNGSDKPSRTKRKGDSKARKSA